MTEAERIDHNDRLRTARLAVTIARSGQPYRRPVLGDVWVYGGKAYDLYRQSPDLCWNTAVMANLLAPRTE